MADLLLPVLAPSYSGYRRTQSETPRIRPRNGRISTTRLSVIILTAMHIIRGWGPDMASNDSFILRAGLNGKMSIYRDIEIEPSKSLYNLAEAIVAAFRFDFDHAFGFYSGLKPATMMRTLPQYELFTDVGEGRPGVGSVKKTRTAQAFPEIGHTMMFLFDYGDDWRFRVSLKAEGTKVAKVRYPRVVATHGDAPPQYPDPDDIDEDDRPSYGIDPLTGEKIWIRR